jgi:uncharacterized protein (TIGR03000 family)
MASMKTKIFLLALAGCLELGLGSGSAQAQVFYGRFGGRRWGVAVGAPVYYGPSYIYPPAVYGAHGPGIYNYWGTRFYGLPDYGAAMSLYGFPAPVYPPYSPYAVVNGTPYSNGVVDPSITSAPITSSLSATPTTPTTPSTTQPAYPATSTVSDKAEFHVKVPVPNAKIYFNDALVEQQGVDRTLMTPSLQPGTYNYRVRATWTENGIEKTQDRAVSVQPGQRIDLSFGETKVQ